MKIHSLSPSPSGGRAGVGAKKSKLLVPKLLLPVSMA
jgi:hypothetical protein